ncbi:MULTISPECIES: hypothetical protein [Streptomyces]|uniref:DUF3618 domain-containing protein n=2 Tax=Streptomyces phaeochromogenes group TaxID=2838332 RepID=A0ABU0T4V2_9ACTN|nr:MULTISPECIES: hypothetical protein [Streptomyces phaeochromogenes group]MCR3728541.1 hypothetical protein [Streptomyces umbrinus]MCX4556576.1 hypothetical protein [Streptomyces phaeochromogenes]MCX5598173.1 hypothetical protein [Streptomyces phaeochromogenes]MDQ1030713.1 hypothetical protein [Streptomyces umbrinus]WRZ33596.1 hypothetical protein OG931_40560 [Streptomyces phaeochromogenes]
MTADPEHPVVQGELAELRRKLDVAHARVEGGLALLSHRAEQTAKEVNDLSARIVTLEHTRWPLRAVAVVTAVGALAVAVYQALGR